MNYLATTNKWLIAALALFLVPTLSNAQDLLIIDNGTIATGAFGGGQIGGDCTGVPSGTYTGFAYGGEGGDGTVLCGSGFLLATSPTNVIGPGSRYTPGAGVDWTEGTWAPSTSPFPVLEVANVASFSDNEGTGIDVDFSVYYSDDDDGFEQFFVAGFEVHNNSGGSLDLTPAQWMDWDNDPFTTNTAEHDGLSWQWVLGDGTGAVNTYGTAVLVDALSGTDCSHPGGTDDVYYANMIALGASPCAPADIRGPVGAGTRTVADGESTTAWFCIIGADDPTDFEAQVANCVTATTVAIEPGPDGLPGTHNLSAVYPNPFNPQANFTLEVAEQQSVRIAVYDALGREVAMLFNGTLTAGPEHAFTIDGAGLPSGVYMVRAVGEQFTDMRRVTLMK